MRITRQPEIQTCGDAVLVLRSCRRDYLLKVQDIDNIAKRIHAYPTPPKSAPIVHPASISAASAPAQQQQEVRLFGGCS